MDKIQQNIRFGRKNASYDFSKTDKGVQRSAFGNNAAADSIFKKFDKDHNNILDAKELAEMNKDIQEAASAHNSKNMGKKEAANFLGSEYEGGNAQKDILDFLNTIGSTADTVQSAFTDNNSITTVKYNPENDSQLTEIYKNNGEKSILNSKTITNSGDNSTTTITYDETGKNPVSKTIKKGSTTLEVDPQTDRPLRKITDKGSGIQEITVYEYDDEKGTVTETTTDQDGNVISTKVKNKSGNEIQQKTEVDKTKSEEFKPKEEPEKEQNNKNYKTIIVQNGESLSAIAKKFGCSVEELKELNKDQLKGKGNNQYFDVGAEIKLPDSVSDEQYTKASEGRKPAEMAKAEYEYTMQKKQERAEAEKQEKTYFQKNCGVKSFDNKGKKVQVELSGGKKVDVEIIGQLGYGRQLVRKGNKVYTISHDNKVLKEEYIQAHKAFVNKPKNQRNNTASGIDGVTYVKDEKGNVWYFDEKTGKAIIKNDYKNIVKQESAYVANQLHTAAKGMLTDNELLEQGVRNIYSADILAGVNAELKAKDSDYAGDAQTMPVEALILDENNHKSARPLFRTLIQSGAMSTKEIANTVKREMDYEIKGDGNIGRAFTHFEFGTGYTSTADLSEIMQMATDRNVRLEIENLYKNDGVKPDESGSYVRTALKNDGWNAQEVDQFDANWVKSGAYSEAKLIQARDEYGFLVFDENGEPVYELDENGEAKVEWGDQQHRNDVIQRLVFNYNSKEALNKGLDACNDDQNSSDYISLNDRAGEVIAQDADGKYQSRFTNQNNIQRYLAGFHSDTQGNVDAGEVSASNTCLYKGVKPARIQAEEALYGAKNGDYSRTFINSEPETYAAMAELVANGDVDGIKDMKELYNKAYESARAEQKTTVKANAMLSGQVKFSDKEITKFCVELMHDIDHNRGIAGSRNENTHSATNGMGGSTNLADTQTEQLKAILQANPQILASLKQQIQNGDFKVEIVVTAGVNTKVNTQDTKEQYLNMLADTKTISNEEVFLDEKGNRITDEAQINAIKQANMQSLAEMRKYVAELERDFKKGVDAEGALSDAGNAILETSGLGTDRTDVANRYRQAKLMLSQFEQAAQGKLRDSKGNVISAQDLAKQITAEQDKLAEANSDYKQSVAYAKMGIVMAPVIVATMGAGAGVAAIGGGTMAAATGSGLMAGATTYGMNALEYNTSYTGNTAEARERNLQDSAIAAGTTAIGVGQMKYIGSMGNNLGTAARTGIRLGTTVAADTAVGAAAEGIATGDVTITGIGSNMIMSGVGNVIGYKSLGRKIPDNIPHQRGGVHVTQDAPTTGRNEIADAEIARNIDQKHLNTNERKMIADEMEAQGTPTEAQLQAYHEEHKFKPVSEEDMPAYQAHQEQVAKDYAETHRLENNAKIEHEKAPKAVNNSEVTALENEIGALDGQIKRLNQQLAGAKRANQMGRKNGDTIKKLESQIESLQQKRTAKAAELETARKPVEVKTETVINDVKSINSSEIPPQHQKLWENCKAKIEKLTQDLSMPTNISTKELVTRGKELLSNLKTIADNVTGSIKVKIESLINDIKTVLNNTKKQIQNTYVNDLSKKQKEAVYTLREIYHSDLDDVATLRMDYPQYNYMSDKQLLDFFKLDEKHAAFVKNRKDLYANGDAKYMERAYWNDSPYELTNNHSAWKMHLYSVDELDYQQMAEVVLPYLNKHKIAHKTLSSTMSPELLAKTAPEQTGKAFTIYPQSKEEMAQVAKDLDKLIREHNLTKNNSHITGDNQLGNSGRLFYRYEYKTGKLKDRIYTPEENNLMHAAYDSNRGEGKYLANDMTPADDPWLNFDPANPSSKPKTNHFDNDVELVEVEPSSPHFNDDVEIIEVQPASTPVITPEHRMHMGIIGNNISRARTLADLEKAQQWLDKIPECSQKQHLQRQIDEKKKKFEPQTYEIDLTNDKQNQAINWDNSNEINEINNAAMIIEQENFYNAENNFHSFDDGSNDFNIGI